MNKGKNYNHEYTRIDTNKKAGTFSVHLRPFAVSKLLAISFLCALLWPSTLLAEAKRPNIVILFSDDISASEMPIYGATEWADLKGKRCSDPNLRAKTPVLDKLATDGCWVRNAWSATSCMPSRAMLMTGRYATIQKWWENGDLGTVNTPDGKKRTWLLYESSPIQLGQVAKKGGYASVWAGKTQMHAWEEQFQRFGFDEGVLTPGDESNVSNIDNSFRLDAKYVDGKVVIGKYGWPAVINRDTGKDVPGAYPSRSGLFKPHVTVMNERGAKLGIEWKSSELNDYGPDYELEYCLDFMERQHKKGKPFFVYHATHLGHDCFDWLLPESGNKWPGTPVAKWDGDKYERTPVNITGEKGVYDTHGTVSEPGIHSHINYLDYMTWRYIEKMKELGIENDTIFIFLSDNGTSGFGKHQVIQQRGTQVPMIIYAPGILKKKGEQNTLVSLTDVLPTLAEMMEVEFPHYELSGNSFWKWMTTDETELNDWIYSYNKKAQMIRGLKVLRDGHRDWWDVENVPADLTSFPKITDWSKVSQAHRDERDMLETELKRLDLHATAHDAPVE